ncbi:hypothetical protein [Novosphingobium aquimarinum]|uniref:hypothetical protein n=1 Tax=Novosphingobium aquimarinum TaxID=2682494 RepID=UPI0012EB9C4D|nr:hypothetical protein [Novosphingobium aquimarinum]
MPKTPIAKPLKSLVAGAFLAALPVSAFAQPAAPVPSGPTYADLADLADSAPLVIKANVRKAIKVKNERAPGLRPGRARYYVEARTTALLSGASAIGESLAYLVDLPLDARGKAPSLKKQDVIIFARPVPGRPGELQLVKPDAQLFASQANEAKVREIITALLSPATPAKVTGVREIIFVPGTLAGEGETQMFLSTVDRSAASITVRHEPGRPPLWGVSFSELVADVSRPPERGTIEWYRLACFLPQMPPPGANLSESAAARQQAETDYRLVIDALGPCDRTIS